VLTVRRPRKLNRAFMPPLFAVVVGALTAGVVGPSSTVEAAPVEQAGGQGACHSNVEYSSLPVWARSGFRPADIRMRHVIGKAGDIVAILWRWPDPLLSPASATYGNKILWVSRVAVTPLSNLRIQARRMVGATPVGPVQTRVVAGGPGPSEIDMPSPGCWRFTLQWSGHVDTLDLQYTAPAQ
jgi:hypothetical protein